MSKSVEIESLIKIKLMSYIQFLDECLLPVAIYGYKYMPDIFLL